MTPDLDTRLSHRSRPAAAPVMFQRWEQLLFLHWRWDAREVQATLPAGLHVDTFDGSAWLGVVPFFMRAVRPRFLPRVPGLSDFLELNLRTYVYDERGRSGVWFYSLDCDQPVAVWLAQTLFHLPYRHATMSAAIEQRRVRYLSRRRNDDEVSRFDYRIRSPTREAAAGSLEFFLAERYLLFSKGAGALRVGRVHHVPYPLADVELDEWSDRVIVLDGFESPRRTPDHVIGSAGVAVEIFGLTRD